LQFRLSFCDDPVQLSEELEKVDEKLNCTLLLLDNKVPIQDCSNVLSFITARAGSKDYASSYHEQLIFLISLRFDRILK